MLQTVRNEFTTTKAGRDWRQQNIDVIAGGFDWVRQLLQVPEAPAGEDAALRYREVRLLMRDAGEPAAIDRLAEILRLAPADEDILLLALASQRLGLPKVLTPAMLQSLLAPAGLEASALLWDRLAASAPLRRFRLIETGEGPLSALTPMTLDERIGRLLLGDFSPDERVHRLLLPVEGGTCLAKHLPAVESMARQLRLRQRSMAMITGPAHSGRHAAAQVLAGLFNLSLAVLRPRALEQISDLVPVLAREAVLGGFAVLIDASSADVLRLIEDRFSSFEGLLIIVAETRPDFGFDVPTLALEAPDLADRVDIWTAALSTTDGDNTSEAAALAAQFKLGPRGAAAAQKFGGDLWQACRAEARRALEALAERIVPRYGWDDIVLPPDILHDLRAAAAQVHHHATVYHQHGFARKQARGQGVSVLLSGPSGTGKTMAAEVLARELELDFFRIDLSRIVSKYIGETEKNLRAVFDAAELGGAVLFFDEADALFGKRSEVKDSHDRFANIEVSYLLQRMESYSGLAVLATNMKSHLDPAFLRRLRFVLDVPFPDATARKEIWKKTFPEQMPRTALDFDALARLDIAGGNIAVIAINAAFLAATEEIPLCMAHIARAARAEYRKLDRELRVTWGSDG